jgi:hypothetical protein
MLPQARPHETVAGKIDDPSQICPGPGRNKGEISPLAVTAHHIASRLPSISPLDPAWLPRGSLSMGFGLFFAGKDGKSEFLAHGEKSGSERTERIGSPARKRRAKPG